MIYLFGANLVSMDGVHADWTPLFVSTINSMMELGYWQSWTPVYSHVVVESQRVAELLSGKKAIVCLTNKDAQFGKLILQDCSMIDGKINLRDGHLTIE